jgi:two-component sensor histidine kinase
MSWRERDGPPPSEPKRRGFGYSVLVRMVEHALDAEVALDYSSGGLVWQLEAPYSSVAEHPIETSIRAMRANDYESAHCRG